MVTRVFTREGASTIAVTPFETALPRFHQRVLTEWLTLPTTDTTTRLASTLSTSQVDLHPHQVEAAAFALESLERGGCVLADEVGLGKTIEAGLVVAQLVSEGRARILVLAPASLTAQWQAELQDKFQVATVIVDGRTGGDNAFIQKSPVVVASLPFAAQHAKAMAAVPWDLVVIDEAHRLRNSHRAGNKTGPLLRAGLGNAPRLLLTATPLQNRLSDLFGLFSFLDGSPLEALGAAAKSTLVLEEEGKIDDLRARLKPLVHRTLRRQVREFLRFPDRRSFVEDFTPLPEEQALYEDTSEYLRRPNNAAFEPSRRTLLLLVCRKLLASSTFALAPTLRALAASLAARSPSSFRPEELGQFREEAEGFADSEDGSSQHLWLDAREREVALLETLAARAESVRVNAKGEALKRAIDRIFTLARASQWPEKAVVFTESRRTLEYLATLLEGRGYRLSRLTGDASTPEMRSALLDEFRHRTSILLSTEAGAEGLNLQFCNLVVNYDLPWNPQRLEQRIGRCHRLGQQRDVVVVNFLNRANAVDARLHELLEHKLRLFDGVFGASDAILGALGNGLDFERRIFDIYQSCRTPQEIDAAFDALTSELGPEIDERMVKARALLFERFDDQVRARLRLTQETFDARVTERRVSQAALSKSVASAPTATRAGLTAAAERIRTRAPERLSFLALDGRALSERLAHLRGSEGWWFVYRCDVIGPRPTSELLHLLLVKCDATFVSVEGGEALLQIPARDELVRKPTGLSPHAVHEAAYAAGRSRIAARADEVEALRLAEKKERADRRTEDALNTPRANAETARRQWDIARNVAAQETLAAKRLQLLRAADAAEREFRRQLRRLRESEDAAYAEKDANLVAQSRVTITSTLIATAYFWTEDVDVVGKFSMPEPH